MLIAFFGMNYAFQKLTLFSLLKRGSTMDMIIRLISVRHSISRAIILRVLILILFTSMSQIASAQLVKIRAGSQSVFGPDVTRPCFSATVERKIRAASRTQAECVFEDGVIRAETFATSGSGVLPVDVTAEVKIVVSHFQVDTAADATATSYIPIHISVPVSWKGRFFNMTVFPAAVASINMYLRLRETDAADPNVAGALVSQVRFQGASHGGISSCMSIPTDTVSAATMLAGCGLAVTEKEEGQAFVELSGVIRTNQPYSIELVARADLTAALIVDPYNGYVPERVNFKDGFGMTWSKNAVVRVGTDAERVVSGIKEEVAMLAEDLAMLRKDFDGHYHTYLTGRGDGHNKTVAETPTPLLSEQEVESEPDPLTSLNVGLAASANLESTTSFTSNNVSKTDAESIEANVGAGSFGIPTILALLLLAIRRRSEKK
jgi:hypothetical protein